MAEKHSTVQGRHLGPKAEAVRKAAEHLAGFLPDKVMAYGAAHDIQPHIWAALLQQYMNEKGEYVLPPELFLKGHVPRITRVLDRLIRIVSNPAIDPMGENPWLDAAGDCIAGMVMQGSDLLVAEPLRPVDTNSGDWCQDVGPGGLQCMRQKGHGGMHRNESDTATWEWNHDHGSGSFRPRTAQGGGPAVVLGEDARGHTVARNTWGKDWGPREMQREAEARAERTRNRYDKEQVTTPKMYLAQYSDERGTHTLRGTDYQFTPHEPERATVGYDKANDAPVVTVVPGSDTVVGAGMRQERKGSPFVAGPAPCAHCGSRTYTAIDFATGVCSQCPESRQRAKDFVYEEPHPRDTRIWNEGPVHPEEEL